MPFDPPCRRIALLGAPATGKTRLSLELAAHLQSRGLRAVAVPEVLHAWVAREGRHPQAGEQLAIAQEQERRLEAALAGADIVLADTSALMVAIHAGRLSGDDDLYRFALARQKLYDASLVTGLDLPWTPPGQQPGAAAAREQVDALVRTLLQRAGLPFHVVYGTGRQRLQSALGALRTAGALPAAAVDRDEARPRPWTWVCEKCSDPECEHRLFTQLREARG